MHNVFRELDSKLRKDGAIEVMLDVPKIIEEFSLPQDKQVGMKSAFEMVNAAFASAIPLAGLAPALGPIGAISSVFSGVFGYVVSKMDESEDKTIKVADLFDIIRTFFTELGTSMDETLRNAIGLGDASKLPDMPLGERDWYGTPIGQFFGSGRWLMYDIGGYLNDFIEAGIRTLVSLNFA